MLQQIQSIIPKTKLLGADEAGVPNKGCVGVPNPGVGAADEVVDTPNADIGADVEILVDEPK